MKKALLLTTITCICLLLSSQAQNVFNPNDSVVNYNSASPPVIPPLNTISKWVRTPRMTWNTNRFKAYYYNDMAMRLRFPNGYNPADPTKKYPVILFFHGGGEVENVNDNELQLFNGAQLFEQKINAGEFDGFMLFPQVRSGGAWDYSYYTKVSNILDSLQKYCNLDLDRVICMGLSNGGLGALNFAVSFPQRASAIISASPALIQVVTPYMNNITHIPIWLATGGLDINPYPATVQSFVDTFAAKGGDIRSNLYATVAHFAWEPQWAEPYLLPYWNNSHKANPLVFFNRTKFNSGSAINAKLGISPGFYQYEWTRDNVVIPGATSNEIVATQFGTYRVHFKRTATSTFSAFSPVPVVISADDVAPSVPANLKVDYSGRTFITLDWDNSTDNDVVTSYDIYVNGQKKYTTEGSAITVDNLTANTAYNFRVSATDHAGNTSALSTQLVASTSIGAAGLNYRYFEGDWKIMPNFNTLTPVKIGTTPNIDITTRNVNDYFGFVWEGYINIPAPGDYTFETMSDDGSKVYFNSFYNPTMLPLVNNDGVHSSGLPITGTVNIPAAGSYPIAVAYFDKNQGESMQLYWSGPGIQRQPVPNSAFFNTFSDVTPPSAPANVRVSAAGGTYLDLTWDPSTDNASVSSYDVYVNDVKKSSTATNSISLNSLSLATTYKITVKALDRAGNASAFSTAVNANTAAAAVNGLKYRYYEGNWSQVPDFNALTPVKTGTTAEINLTPKNLNDYFGFVWEGHINIPTPGTYTFETVSDDGSKLYFNSYFSASATPLVNNDGLHGPYSPVAGNVNIPAAGSYPFAVAYFENSGGEAIEVYMTGPGIPRTLITASYFRESVAQATAPGLQYRYYEGDWNVLPDFNALTPVKKGTTPNVDLSLRNRNDLFGFVWEGNINIPTPGNYTFETVSDDGSKVYFNTTYSATATPLVNNDGIHGPWSPVGATVNVPAAGAYPFAVTFFEKDQGEAMQLYWTGPGIARQLVPASAFSYNQSADNGAPSTPLNVKVVGTGGTYIDLSWDPSTDNVGVAGYDVYVNDVRKATIINPAITLTGLSTSTAYKITIKATDQAGNASGFSQAVNATTSAALVNGLRYRYYEGSWDVLPDFNALTPVKTGISPDINLNPRNRNDLFGFVWEGHINIPTPGTYTFESMSDDGSKVYFNTFYSAGATPLINNDGIHGPWSAVTATVNVVAAGSYPFAVSFFEKDQGEAMQVYWTGPGIPRQLVPASAFVENTGVAAPTTGNALTAQGAIQEAAATVAVEGVYPNPFTDKVYVGLKGMTAGSKVEVNIYDLNGKLMLSRLFGNVPAGSSQLQLDVSSKKFNQGVYIMKTIVNGQPSRAVKLVKTR